MMQCPRCAGRRFRLKASVLLDVVIRIDCLSAEDVHIEQEWVEEPPDDIDVYEEGIECLDCGGGCSQTDARAAFEASEDSEVTEAQQEALFPETDAKA